MTRKNIILAITLIFTLAPSLPAQISNGQGQSGYPPSYAARRAGQRSERFENQNREPRKTMVGSFRQSLQESLNPCNRDYSVVLDGWQNAAVQDTIKNWVFWIAIVLLGAVSVLGFDDWFRKCRNDDVREAFISSSLVLMNDRSMLLRRAKEAILRHNNLVNENDELKRRVDEHSAVQTKQSISEAFSRPEPQLNAGSLSDIIGDGGVGTQPSKAQPYTLENATPIIETDQPEPDRKANSENLVSYKLGGKIFMIEPEIDRHIREMKRKIENLSTQNRLKEEKLRKYGE